MAKAKRERSADEPKPQFDHSRLTIVGGAAGGVGGFRHWHYVANGVNEDFDALLQPGYFSEAEQIHHLDTCYVVAADYVAELVFVRSTEQSGVTALQAWALDLPDDAPKPAEQTLPMGTGATPGISTVDNSGQSN